MAEANNDWRTQRDVLSSNRYMFENHVDCDVTFFIGKQKQEVTVHKYVLISRSSVFYDMLCGPRKETGPINIPDVEPEHFEQLLRFMYYEAFEPNRDSIVALLHAAKKYAVMCLVNRCLKWLKEGLSPDNVCVVLEQAHLFGEQDLREKCIEFIMDNAGPVLKHSSFGNLSYECIDMVLKQDQLEVNEEEVYEAMKNWAGKECGRKKIKPSGKNIRDVLGELRYLIRFSGMNAKYFADKVAVDEILTSEEKIDFFRGFQGSSNLAVKNFNKSKRTPRFQKMETVKVVSGSDTMEFKISIDCLLSGIMIKGETQVAHGRFDLNIEVMLMDEPKRSIMSKTFPTNLSNDQSQQILFDERIVLHRSWYSITLRSSTRRNTRDNSPKIVVKGLEGGRSIEFRNSSLPTNSTSVLSCTISGLLICQRL